MFNSRILKPQSINFHHYVEISIRTNFLNVVQTFDSHVTVTSFRNHLSSKYTFCALIIQFGVMLICNRINSNRIRPCERAVN